MNYSRRCKLYAVGPEKSRPRPPGGNECWFSRQPRRQSGRKPHPPGVKKSASPGKVVLSHPAVTDAAVIGIPSCQSGETPLALVVKRSGCQETEDEIRDWANQHLGMTQRLSAVEIRQELPRSTIGKVLKRELRTPYWENSAG